ncbi:uncharacterized protein FIBRA_03584 [Fibroporia radiculosa]|uniref:Uncharacterized protein n=1 Tax=Fibroporia radiculosa TaxID=599839 RepID=J4G5Z0_9APHY|nr:uncharacterized protein FIBRA_03584 [Fibroporia radiculosa]CCM01528.1 predicted protein [Fibroporia radiculosa]
MTPNAGLDACVSLFVSICYYILPFQSARSRTTALALKFDAYFYDQWLPLWEQLRMKYALMLQLVQNRSQTRVLSRAPLEIAYDELHRSWNYTWWPTIPFCAERKDSWKKPAPGHVRIHWYKSLREAVALHEASLNYRSPSPYRTKEQPEMFMDMPLGPSGELDLSKIVCRWNLENILFVDMSRKSLFQPASPHTMSGLAVQKLLFPGDKMPLLRAVEIPSPETLRVRMQRAQLLQGALRPLRWFEMARVTFLWAYIALRDQLTNNSERTYADSEIALLLVFDLSYAVIVLSVIAWVVKLEVIGAWTDWLGTALSNAAMRACNALCHISGIQSNL